MRKWQLLFLGVTLLAASTRFLDLGVSPSGFYSDEGLYGYEAYSLLKTGKDQFGNAWPLSIAGFGDFRPALYIYTTIPFIAVFGLTEFAVRAPSAFFSFLTVIVTYLFVHSVTKNRKIALLSMLIISISPLAVYFGRMAHETNLMTLLIITGLYILWKGQGSLKSTIIKIVFFALSFYTYHTARVFVPLYLLVTIVIFRKSVLKHKKQFLFGIAFFFILLIPLGLEILNGEALSRVKSVGFWNDPGIIASINEKRRVAQLAGENPIVTKLTNNKLVVLPQVFMHNFLSHFSADFLLLKGDPNGIYNTPNVGILTWIEPVAILLGFVGLWLRSRKIFYWILAALLIGIIPDSLTRVAPSSARIHVILPFLALAFGVGMYDFNKQSKKSRTLFLIPLTCFVFWFWHNYLTLLPIKNARAWQIGVSKMVIKTQEYAPQYEKIWMSRECWGWIHVVFHTKYDPKKFQMEAKPSQKNDLGFWWVSDFDKYHLEWFPENYSFNDVHTLYVGIPSEFPENKKPLEIIRHPQTNQELFWIVSGNSQIITPQELDEGYL